MAGKSRGSLARRAAFVFALCAIASNVAVGEAAMAPASSDAAHPRLPREWWRFSVRARARDGRDFGVVATYFRSTIDGRSGDAVSAVLAVTDLSNGVRGEFERSGRSQLGSAGASATRISVDVGTWSARALGRTAIRPSAIALYMPVLDGGVALVLSLPQRAEIDDARGYFEDGATSDASHYFAYTRCAVSGTITIDRRSDRVTGFGWVDHVYGGAEVSSHPVWSLYELQLSDGRDVMLYEFRDRDGRAVDKTIVVDADRRAIVFATVTTAWRHGVGPYFWRSRRTGSVYPDIEHITVERVGIDVLVSPAAAAQEFAPTGGAPYWDGATNVSDFASAKKETGIGFAQLTGYDASGAP